MEKRISSIMFLFRMDLARERALVEEAINNQRADQAAKLSGSHRPTNTNDRAQSYAYTGETNYGLNATQDNSDEDIEQLDGAQ